MKKIFYSLFAMAFAAMTFSSCEDVPMPYDDPNNQPLGPELEEGVLLKETFASNFGDFAVLTTNGYGWIISHSTATGTGYQNGTNQESESYLISPEIDLTDVESAHIAFDYLMAYTQNAGDDELLITYLFNDEAPSTTQWDVLEGTSAWKAAANGDWNTFTPYLKNIPDKYMGRKIRIAFRFTGLDKSKTWEIKNVVVKIGVGDEVNGEPVEPAPEGAYFYETFSQDFGSFTTMKTIADGYDWFISYNCAQGTGYQNKTNKPSAAYLISPEVDLSTSEKCYLQFEYQLNTYGNEGNNKVLITDNYTGDPTTTHWYTITGKLDEVSAWNWDNATTYKFNLPVDVAFTDRSKVRIAFYFDAGEKSQTWEIRNVMLMEGDAGVYCDWVDEYVDLGTYADPLTVDEALAVSTAGVWVSGYIVGYCDASNNVVFGASGAVNTNLVIAADPNETDPTKCMPVFVQKSIRSRFGLGSKPELLKKKVIIYGDIEEYLYNIGLKNVYYLECNGDIFDNRSM